MINIAVLGYGTVGSGYYDNISFVQKHLSL